MALGLGLGSASETKVKFQTYDSRLAAADQASIIDNRAGGKNSKITAANAPLSVAISGSGDNQIQYNITDGGALATAADLVKASLAATSSATAAGLAAVQETTDQLAALAETKITDGANLNQKTTIVALVAFAVVGLVAWIFFKR